MKKNWTNPEVSELNVAETQYGGKKPVTADNTYVNEENNWERTFES